MNFGPVAIMMQPWLGDDGVGPAPYPASGSWHAVEPEKPSIWKREISFRRRRSESDPVAKPDPVAAEAIEGADPPEKPSIWKREISFRRRRDKDEQVAPEPEAAPEHEPAAEAPEDADPPEQPSIWKREISFRRRREEESTAQEPEVEPEPQAEGPAVEAAESSTTPGEPLPEHVAEPPQTTSWSLPSFEPADPPPPPDFRPAATQPEHVGWETTAPWGQVDEPAASEPERPEEVSASAPPYGAGPIDDASGDAAEDAPRAEVSPERLPEPEPEPAAVPEPEPAPVGAWPVEAEEPPADAPAGEEEQSFLDFDLEPEPEPAPEKRRGLFSRRRKQTKEAVPEPVFQDAELPSVKPERAPERDERGRASRGSKRGVKLVGLKLGGSQIAAAHVRNNGSREVLKVARVPLERGVVVSGELRDPERLAEALKAFFKAAKLPKRNVRLGIGSNRVGVRVLDVAGVDDPKLLGNAVRFRAQEVLPIPLSEAVLDYRVLSEELGEEGETVKRVLVAFAYRELVDRYLAACKKAGIRLVGIDLEGFALLRALVPPETESSRPEGAAVVTVSLGHDRSIMSVSDGSVCEFTRVIEWGGSVLDTAVARILALTPSQAEPTKRALTLDPSRPVPEGLNAEQAARARNAMLHEVNSFAREFVSSLQFYQAQPGSLDIGEIVVTGGTAHMPGLVDELQRVIGVGVRLGDPLARVKLGRRVAEPEQVGSLALAIGLGIED